MSPYRPYSELIQQLELRSPCVHKSVKLGSAEKWIELRARYLSQSPKDYAQRQVQLLRVKEGLAKRAFWINVALIQSNL